MAGCKCKLGVKCAECIKASIGRETKPMHMLTPRRPSAREFDGLLTQLVAEGLSDGAIADRIGLTDKQAVYRARRRLGLNPGVAPMRPKYQELYGEVVKLAAAGWRDLAIARHLGIKRKSTVSDIRKRMGVRGQAVGRPSKFPSKMLDTQADTA